MILKVCALSIIISVCAFLLKEFGWRGIPIFLLISFVGIISLAEPYLSSAISVFNSISDEFGISGTASSVLKIIGVGYLGGLCSDVCCELGAASISTAVSLVTRLEIMAICAPFFLEIVKLGTDLIG